MEQTNKTPETNQDSHTTIGITEVKKEDMIGGDLDATANVSFEVPLYVTTAAIGGQTALATPKTYDIKNNGTRGIVVTRMQIEKLAGSTWSTVEEDNQVDDDKKVKLAIGGLTMPATKGDGVKVDAKLAVDGTENAFTKNTGYKVIEKDHKTLSTSKANVGAAETMVNKKEGDANTNIGLAIAGKVAQADNRASKGAASQFKVTYVVSAITKNADDNLAGGDGTVNKDQIVGFTYVGDDKVAAGLAKN